MINVNALCEEKKKNQDVAQLGPGDLANSFLRLASRQFHRKPASMNGENSRRRMVRRRGKKLKAGRRTDAFVSLTDLTPTFLEIAGPKKT